MYWLKLIIDLVVVSFPVKCIYSSWALIFGHTCIFSSLKCFAWVVNYSCDMFSSACSIRRLIIIWWQKLYPYRVDVAKWILLWNWYWYFLAVSYRPAVVLLVHFCSAINWVRWSLEYVYPFRYVLNAVP